MISSTKFTFVQFKIDLSWNCVYSKSVCSDDCVIVLLAIVAGSNNPNGSVGKAATVNIH